MSIFLVIAILILLVIVHELGHFSVAKWLGVKVKEFGVGYPPRAVRIRKIGETEYTLNWLPFGGFVRLFGEDGSEKGAGSFFESSRGVQALILVAGVVANVLAGWLLFTGGFMFGMPAAVEPDDPSARVIISHIVPFSPAHDSALRVGDEVIAVEAGGERVEMLTPDAVSAFIQKRGGATIDVSFKRDNTEMSASLVPVHAVLPEMEGRPALGIALTSIAERKLPFFEALVEAGKHTLNSLVLVVVGLSSLAYDAITGGVNLDNLVGPVGLVNVVGDAAGQGFGHLFGLAAFISINLAIINLIPIPALDGGRLLFVGLEAITRRRVPEMAFKMLNTLGFLFIIFLMLAVTFNDIVRIVG